MPPYLVAPYLASRQLVELEIVDEYAAPTRPLPVYAAHVGDRHLGLGGRWLLDDLRKRLAKERRPQASRPVK